MSRMESIRESAPRECPFTMAVSRTSGAAGRTATLAYGVAAYALFFVTFCYGVGFVGNWFVPTSIDSSRWFPPISIVPSMLLNAALLSVFVVQHTVMARPAFKRWWTTIIPRPVERSTYVLTASASLAAVFVLWRPIPGVVWHVDNRAVSLALQAISLGGWAMVLLTSFVINHFDLFGLRQVWMRFRNLRPTPVGFRLAGPYRIVRHPLMVGFLIAFWATPHMSVGHLFFAVLTTGYILMGTWFEERDLVAEHGESYLEYRRRVRGLVPLPKLGSGKEAA